MCRLSKSALAKIRDRAAELVIVWMGGLLLTQIAVAHVRADRAVVPS